MGPFFGKNEGFDPSIRPKGEMIMAQSTGRNPCFWQKNGPTVWSLFWISWKFLEKQLPSFFFDFYLFFIDFYFLVWLWSVQHFLLNFVNFLK